jgi:tetratricopeptide (TPR) repeat protein
MELTNSDFWLWTGVIAGIGGFGIGVMFWAYAGAGRFALLFAEPLASLSLQRGTTMIEPSFKSAASAPAVTALEAGDTAFRARRFSLALDCYSQAVKLDPTLAAAYHNRGLAAANLRRDGDAARDLSQAGELYLQQEQRQRLSQVRENLEVIKEHKDRKSKLA